MDTFCGHGALIILLAFGGFLGDERTNVCSSFQLNSIPLRNGFLPSSQTNERNPFAFNGSPSPHHPISISIKSPAMFSTATPESAESAQATENQQNSNGDDGEEEGIGAWVPLLSIKGMTGLGPQRITVMGIDLVVWHTEADQKKGEKIVWTAQVDACAHRLAPLSQGRVNPNTNCVECP